MAINFVDMVSRQLTPDLIGKMGNVVGESPSTVTRAATLGIPSILGAIAQRGSTEPGARGLIDSIRAGGYDTASGSSLGSMLDSDVGKRTLLDRGQGILTSLFGGGLDGAISGLGSKLGLSSRSSGGILAMLAPVIMSVLGNHVRENNLSAAGLSTLLRGQSSFLSPSYVPHGAREVAISGGRHAAQSKGWLWGVLGVAALALGGGIFLCNRKTEMSKVEMPAAPKIEPPTMTLPETPSMAPPSIGGGPPAMNAPAEPAPGVEAPKMGEPSMEAPKMEAPKMGEPSMEAPKMEAPKMGELKAAPTEAPKAVGEKPVPERFYLKGLRYDTGTTNLTVDDGTLDRVAKTLERNPNRHILIEGFTDETGSAERNQELSRARAESAKQALVDKGADPERIETAGFSADYPIAKNSTPAGRAANRRVEIVVTGR